MVFMAIMKRDSNLLLEQHLLVPTTFPLDPALPCLGSYKKACPTLPPETSVHLNPSHPHIIPSGYHYH